MLGGADELEVFLILLLERETTPLVYARAHWICPSEGGRWQKRDRRSAGEARTWVVTEQNSTVALAVWAVGIQGWAVEIRVPTGPVGSGPLRPRSQPA